MKGVTDKPGLNYDNIYNKSPFKFKDVSTWGQKYDLTTFNINNKPIVNADVNKSKSWLLEGFRTFIKDIKKEPLDLLVKVFEGLANKKNSNGETVVDSWLNARAKIKADKIANLITAKNTIEDIISTKK